MSTKIQLKRGLNANFGSVALASGEPAFITDTGKLYIGNGTEKIPINPMDKPVGLDTTNPYTKVTVNEYGQIVTQANLIASDIPNISNTQVIGLGTAALKNTGTAADNIPILDSNGKLVPGVLPSIAVTNTFVVSSESAMLALDCEVGDIAVRTDINQTFILQQSPAGVLANWVEFLTPTDTVSSVNGQTGTVVLGSSDLLMTGYTKPATYSPIAPTDNTSVSIGKLERNFDNYAALASPALTGIPTAPTPLSTDSSTAIATTAFVQSLVSVIDGGSF